VIIRDVLSRIGLSSTAAARLIGVEARTMRSWCQPPETLGHRVVPEPVLRILDLLEHVPGARARLHIIAQERRP
jgi:hypothetical protein